VYFARIECHPTPAPAETEHSSYKSFFWRADDPHRRPQDEQQVIQMNEVRRRASARVQLATSKVAPTIDEPGHPTGHLAIPLKEETIMFKTISAVLLAVSVLAAPAMAASRTPHAPAIKTAQVKHSVLNANAKMGRHHHKHVRHHPAHKQISTLKKHQFSKVTIKHATPANKRG
jgi:hypothetical protein